MKPVSKVQVRLEGEVNQNWTVTYMDGSVENFYACEESPRYEANDERVYNRDQQLSDFLQEMIDLGSSLSGWDPECDCVEYDVDMITRTIYNVEYQKPDGNGDYVETNCSDTYSF